MKKQLPYINIGCNEKNGREFKCSSEVEGLGFFLKKTQNVGFTHKKDIHS